MELEELTSGLTDSIGWAEDACMCISEVWSNPDETWLNPKAKEAFDKIGAAIDLLKEARASMADESSKAQEELDAMDRSDSTSY